MHALFQKFRVILYFIRFIFNFIEIQSHNNHLFRMKSGFSVTSIEIEKFANIEKCRLFVHFWSVANMKVC